MSPAMWKCGKCKYDRFYDVYDKEDVKNE